VQDVLITARLVLRPVGERDRDALAAHWRRPDVRRFLFDGEVLSREEIDGIVESGMRGFAEGGPSWLWVIREAGGEALVGTAGLRPLEDLGPELVYSLEPAFWGKGYATEAAAAVLEHALGPLGLPEVLAEVDEGNAASVAVVERLGMSRFDVVAGLLGPMIRFRRRASAQ